MGGGAVRGERGHDRGSDPASARRREGNATAGAGGTAGEDSCAIGDAGERAVARDRQDGSGGSRGAGGDTGGLQAREAAPREGRAGAMAFRPGATGGAGAGTPRQRVRMPRRGGVLPEDGAAGAGGIRGGAAARNGGIDRAGVGDGGGRGDSTAAGGFAEVSGLLAGGDLPAG